MTDIGYITERVVRAVPCVEAGRMMGIPLDSRGRCKCPFHGGEHNNLKLYGEDRGYYCFVCHAYGNVINLVMKYRGMKYMEAVGWLNDVFSIGLDLDQKSYRSRLRRAERLGKHRGAGNGDTDTGWDERQKIAKRNQTISRNDQKKVL